MKTWNTYYFPPFRHRDSSLIATLFLWSPHRNAGLPYHFPDGRPFSDDLQLRSSAPLRLVHGNWSSLTVPATSERDIWWRTQPIARRGISRRLFGGVCRSAANGLVQWCSVMIALAKQVKIIEWFGIWISWLILGISWPFCLMIMHQMAGFVMLCPCNDESKPEWTSSCYVNVFFFWLNRAQD